VRRGPTDASQASCTGPHGCLSGPLHGAPSRNAGHPVPMFRFLNTTFPHLLAGPQCLGTVNSARNSSVIFFPTRKNLRSGCHRTLFPFRVVKLG